MANEHARPGLAIAAVSLFALLIGGVGCESEDVPPPPVVQEPTPAPSPWRTASTGATLGLTEEAVDDLLANAIAEAQRTAPEAREAWAARRGDDDHHWAVQCVATTIDGRREYIWVRPTHWSAHRIEGVMLSEPQGELLGGEQRGDPIAFSADDLTDWLHQRQRGRDGFVQEGGFTIAALESAFGAPGPAEK